ncbi:hypothetical protein PA598K_03941 [Paenibacillus sp. 598K]|uniref:sensor histidine kinase n=1 Tax=Paenibacillus sp. 598K TaxID=1117987 RepID=UPI000FF95153|nr:histidine kinase [Paenibacillus sp. 598K]GBF75524.1 hypothetical protein PA598K_03941 [Paenibacillus sp. 598K]
MELKPWRWKPKITLSMKFTLILLVLLGIVLALNSNVYRVSVNVIEQDVQASYYEQLRFFQSQLENQIDSLATNVLEMEEDTTVKQFVNTTAMEDLYDRNKLRLGVLEKIKLQSASSNWMMDISVYVKSRQEVISTRSDTTYNLAVETSESNPDGMIWSYEPGTRNAVSNFVMLRDGADYRIEARFSASYIAAMLDGFQQDHHRNTLLYHAEQGLIGTGAEHFQAWLESADRGPLNKPDSRILLLAGERVLVNSFPVSGLGWTIVDLVPLGGIVLPIEESRQSFVMSILAMLILCIVLTALIYRQVQAPINQLILRLRDIRAGKFSSRLSSARKDEFEAVFAGFNGMADHIQELIEKVYEEKLRSKEAELKQLQSQINPHFLYNCLFYIKNMAKLGAEEEVVAMALNLGEYYRYTTRLDNPVATIREEVKLLQSYLNIQTMRSNRIRYDMDISEQMLDIPIPRLFIQPLVENAILHGLEKTAEGGLVRIACRLIAGGFEIGVEDSGAGVQAEGLERLRASMHKPLSEESGCGIWNTHQRVVKMYAPGSGLAFATSELGGLQVVIRCLLPMSPIHPYGREWNAESVDRR